MAKRSKKRKAADAGISRTVAAPVVAAQQPLSGLSRDWLWGLLLVLAVILTYLPVWWAGFVWDDTNFIVTNPCIVGPFGVKEIWTTVAADICPLTVTTFWLEHALWGLSPLPYHLVNVLLHAACAVVLWRVLRSLQVPGAWLGAALWALHPVQVESAAWITEMKNTESGLFFLLSILFFVRWLKAKNSEEKTGGGWSYALTLVFAALALASKSSTVVLPVVLCLCAWWVEGRWHWRSMTRVVPLFFMSIATGVVSMWTQKLQLATFTDPQFARTWPERLVTAGDEVWFYLGKLLWPYPLTTVYPRWQIDADEWISYLPLLAVILVLFILWFKRESWSRPWFFVFAYFLVALLPVLGLVDNYIFRYSPVFDHLQYLAGMGPLALAGGGMARLADFAIPRRPWLRAALGAGMLLVLGLLSWQRARVFESEETLWTDTLAKNKNSWMAQYNLGVALFKEGRIDEAMANFQRALELNPNYVEAHDDLGAALLQKGQMEGAIDQYKKALEIDPNYAEAHYNLGVAFANKGQVDEAIVQYQKAVEINPNLTEAYNNLGNALLQKGRMAEALAQFQKTLELNPNYALAHDNLGVALLQKGRVDDAIVQFQKALEIDPQNARAHHNLGVSFIKKGRVDEAIAEYQKALAINSNVAETHNNLGIALYQKGKFAEAVAQFQEAVRLKPDFGDAQNNLAKVEAMMRQAHGSK